jgi:hypothetical protein
MEGSSGMTLAINEAIEAIRNEEDAAKVHFIDNKYFKTESGDWWTYYPGFNLTTFARRIIEALLSQTLSRALKAENEATVLRARVAELEAAVGGAT